MLHKFFNFFLSPYKSESMEVQKKAKAFLIGCFIIILGCSLAIYTLFIDEINTSSYIGALVLGFGIVTVIAAMILLKKGHYKAASYVISNIAIIVLGFLSYFTTAAALESSRIICSFLIGLTLTGLIAYNKKQVIIYFLFSVLSYAIIYVMKFNYGMWAIDTLSIKEFVQGVLYLTLCSFFVISIISIFDERIKLSNKQAEDNSERYNKLEALLESAKNGLDIGEKLVRSTDRTLNQIEEINTNFENIETDITALNVDIANSKDFNKKVTDAAAEVNRNIEEYNASVEESSAAIHEMTSSINNISTISQSKRQAISRLVEDAEKSEEDIDNAIEAINKMEKESLSILEVIDVIVNIANQTSLLAMNAAIEAAQAGEAGRGFSVVADEIRKLADETNENIQTISHTLKSNVDNIRITAEINKKTALCFHIIRNTIGEVDVSMQEIFNCMQELAAGNKQIMAGVSNIVNSIKSISSASKTVEQMMDNSNASITGILDKANAMYSRIKNITTAFNDILNESKVINSMGNKNILHIQTLNTKVDELKAGEAVLSKLQAEIRSVSAVAQPYIS